MMRLWRGPSRTTLCIPGGKFYTVEDEILKRDCKPNNVVRFTSFYTKFEIRGQWLLLVHASSRETSNHGIKNWFQRFRGS
jgi:hypothetical protein